MISDEYEFLNRPVRTVVSPKLKLVGLLWAHEITVGEEKLLVTSDGIRLHILREQVSTQAVTVDGFQVVQFPESGKWGDRCREAVPQLKKAVRAGLTPFENPVRFTVGSFHLKHVLRRILDVPSFMYLYVADKMVYLLAGDSVPYVIPLRELEVVADRPCWIAFNQQFLWEAFAKTCGTFACPGVDNELTIRFDAKWSDEDRPLRIDYNQFTAVFQGGGLDELPFQAQWLPRCAEMYQHFRGEK